MCWTNSGGPLIISSLWGPYPTSRYPPNFYQLLHKLKDGHINYKVGMLRVRRSSVSSASACCKAGPSSVHGSAPQGDSSCWPSDEDTRSRVSENDAGWKNEWLSCMNEWEGEIPELKLTIISRYKEAAIAGHQRVPVHTNICQIFLKVLSPRWIWLNEVLIERPSLKGW